MSFYDYWIDGNGNVHRISDMSTEYIKNCLNQLDKMANSWRFCTEEQLSDEELKSIAKPGEKAWYIVNESRLRESLELELAVKEALE